MDGHRQTHLQYRERSHFRHVQRCPRARVGRSRTRPGREAIASAIGTQAVTRADLEPLATKAELRTLQWVVGIQSAITLATFAIVAAKLL